MKSIPLILIAAIRVFAQSQAYTQARPAGVANSQPPRQPVSFDCSADGAVVNALSGEPIPRAKIALASGGSNASTTTDGSGRWSLSNIPCGVSQLIATRPGFLRAGSFPSGNTVNIPPASAAHDVKIQLLPQAVVFGKVLDDQGDPVMGVQIMVLASRIVEGRVRFQQTGGGATNDLGEYRVAGLSRGRYIFCARSNQNSVLLAGTETMAAENCYPGPPDGGAAAAMELPAGREAKVDFRLSQVPAAHVRGTVAGLPQGRGMSISMSRLRGGIVENGGNVPGPVRDGKFDIRVSPGSYMLMADYFETGKRLSARMPIEVGGSDIDNVAIHLDSGFTVTGVIRIESVSAQVADFKPFGLGLRPSEPINASGQLKWEADRTSFAFHETLPGAYRLDISPPAPFYVKSATLAGQDILHREVPISQAAGPIEIVLRDDGGSIEGDILSSSGEPAAGGILLLRNGERATSQGQQSAGHFRLTNLAPGDYTAYAWDDLNSVEYANPDWMRRYAGAGVAITVTAGQTSQVKLRQQTVPSGMP